jgi:hypothetical protein
MAETRFVFLAAAGAAPEVVACAGVTLRWEEPRALPEMTVEALVEVAVLRHGDPAVLRALSRRKRDSAQVRRVL